ncbi:uncharacterized protein DMAD_04501 [Drosophila madeirensis]
MDIKQLYTWACLLLSIIACKLSQCSAKPTYYDLDSYENYDTDRYDRYSGNSYAFTYGKPLTENRLKKLNPGYYYVDDGYIAPVSTGTRTNTRRQDASLQDAPLPSNVKFTPLVRVRETRTKRKKLFVPNFFG